MDASDLHRLATRVTRPEHIDAVLQRALASLGSVIPFDLAVLYELHGPELIPRVMEGALSTPELRGRRLDLDRFPTIQRALDTRRPIALEAHHHEGEEGDPYDGVLDLPAGHSCMVVPLFAGDRSLGLVTLDAVTCGIYDPSIVELAGVYGQLISIAIAYARQAAELNLLRLRLREENRLLRAEHSDADGACRMIERSCSAEMRRLGTLAKQVAASELPVLITGETGSGKEVLAQALHAWSARSEQPFVKVNCAAIPENLVESELFGHVKGAFTGAVRDRAGRFQTADGGTLLLDEVGDMPLPAQAKLLRVLQEQVVEAVGSDRQVKVNVRIIASTHRDLEAMVRQGLFREDLYYRLAVFPLQVPPLRQRADDICALATEILEGLSKRTGRGPWTLSPATCAVLREQQWPGNVRQLRNALERASIFRPVGELEPGDLGLERNERPAATPLTVPDYAENERRYFEQLLHVSEGRIYGEGGAAELAGLKPTTLQSKLKKRGLR